MKSIGKTKVFFLTFFLTSAKISFNANIISSSLPSFGLFNINIFTNLGAFTNSLFLYHPANADGEDYVNGIIGFGYHNAQYQLVVSGFPFYYLTNEGGKNTFLRAKEFIEKDFPY